MKFELIIGLKDIDKSYEIIERTSVKSVIKENGKLLMIQTERGDYKFAGGGIKQNETIEQALHREILEETGFELINIGSTLGTVIERSIDIYDDSKIFVMNSIYVECELNLKFQKELNLDEYEQEQGFKPVFVHIEDAINKNLELINANNNLNPWVYRETEVLKKLVI